MLFGNFFQFELECTSQLIIKSDDVWHDVRLAGKKLEFCEGAGSIRVHTSSSPPEFSFASTAESPLLKTTVHSFSTDRDEPCAPTLLMLPMHIVQIAPAQNQADPSAE